MKNSAAIVMTLALCVPCLAQDPRDAFKQEQASLDAPPPAPRGSLYLQRAPVSAADMPAGEGHAAANSMSFTEVAAAPKKEYRKHDIVTIVVSEESESSTTGSSQTKKTQDFDAALQQFLKLGSTSNGVPAVQPTDPSMLPEAKFSYNNNRQNDSSMDRKDQTTYSIAATIVDIKPNGTLVLEATKQIQNDKEVEVYRLTGVCDSKSIKNGNVVSTSIADLAVSKTTKGEVRDGTKRGWLNGVFDAVSPF